MKVSVIIPTYKRPDLLLKCIAALNQQTFSKKDYEVIVVTDGPDFITLEEIRSFSSAHFFFNLSCYYLQEKKGPAAARNKGVLLAKGELVLFTDDDCIPNTNWVENFWNAYQLNQKELIAFSGKTIVPCTDIPTDYERNIAHLETADFITANCACTKKAFTLINGFDEAFPIAWREDSEFEFRLLRHSIPIIKINDAVITHPVRKASWGISIKEQKKSVFNALLYKKHPRLYKQKIGNRPFWNYYIITALFALFIMAIISAKFIVALICLFTWLLFVSQFAMKRLKGTSKKISHITEMFVTSMFIPILSVYWTLYGSIKYKTLLL